MSTTTPRFGMIAPNGATPLKKLGAELERFANSVDSTLARFDYQGTDPSFLIARVVALESMTTVVERDDPQQRPVTTTAWAEMPITATTPLEITCARAEWWEFELTHWAVLTGSGDLRAGIRLTGATQREPENPSWSTCTYTSPTNGLSQVAKKRVKLNAGKTQVRVVAMRSGGTAASNYQHLTATRLGLAQ